MPMLKYEDPDILDKFHDAMLYLKNYEAAVVWKIRVTNTMESLYLTAEGQINETVITIN